jgi:hypothetical protein
MLIKSLLEHPTVPTYCPTVGAMMLPIAAAKKKIIINKKLSICPFLYC